MREVTKDKNSIGKAEEDNNSSADIAELTAETGSEETAVADTQNKEISVDDDTTSNEEKLDEGNINEDELAVAAAVSVDSTILPEQSEKVEYKKRKGFRYGCYLFVKRTFDIVASGLFLVIFSWLYLILAIVVKCSDGGTVFYKHKRVGKNGKDIYIPKFRSMKKNADDLEHMLTSEQLEQYKREYKIDNDPRVTKVGAVLRKTSLDELPNIWAIFKGDISVIGPRPLMREEAEEKYGEDMDKLLSVRPGMIGWWAANGRSNTTYESGERQKLELYYVDHCSIWLDIKIIFKTIIGVFKREGAK